MKADTLNLPITLEELRHILHEHGVIKASVFGSYARGDENPNSDLDLLVDYEDGVSLFDHLELKDILAKTSGKQVDLLSSRAVSKHLRPYIEKDKVTIL